MGLRKLLIAIFICAGSFVLVGMGRIGPVSIDKTNDPKYANFIGTEYRTLEDLVVYRFSDSKTPSLSAYGDGYIPTKQEMKDKFPFRYEDKKILGVLPIGSVFKIRHVREEGPPSGTFTSTYAEITLSENSSFLGQQFDVNPLAKALSNPPEFKPSLVELVTEE